MAERYLITGATGFVGSCLARELVRRKKIVSIIVRNKNLNWRLLDIASKLDVHESDLLSDNLADVIDKIQPQYIFHLAAYGALASGENRTSMIEANIKGTMRLLQAVRKYPFKLFINTGSSSEYGIKDRPMKETDILEPVNDYGVTKAAATLFCQKEARSYNLPIITYRIFSAYGHFEDKTRLIPHVILKQLYHEEIELSSPNFVRDFVFVGDVVDAYLSATKRVFNPGEIFNVGSGKQKSIEDVVRILMQLSGSKAKVNWGKVKKQHRQVEPDCWVADISKINYMLQWQPRHTLEEGLAKTVLWFSQNRYLYE